MTRVATAPPALLLAVALLGADPLPGEAQAATDRSPNLSGGWVGSPGSLHFNFDHRFWLLGERVFNSPSFLLAAPLPGNLLLGGRYASNSVVSGTSANEWELFGRWAVSPGDWPVELAVTGGYNVHPSSADGELSVVVPVGRVRLLGAARGFSDALNSGEPGFFVGGGVVVPIHRFWSLAGDMGTLRVDGEGLQRVWGAALQLRIPTTPHSMSLQATNTRTGTLQGSSLGGRTTWGFEFTVPFTFARYFRGSGRNGSEEAHAIRPGPADPDEVEVTMTDDLRFAPEEIRIRAGQTVAWRNTTPVPHTVTAHPDRVRDPEQVALPEGAEPFDSGFMFEDDVFRHTFTVPGEYLYVCVPHDMAPMVGRVIVEP